VCLMVVLLALLVCVSWAVFSFFLSFPFFFFCMGDTLLLSSVANLVFIFLDLLFSRLLQSFFCCFAPKILHPLLLFFSKLSPSLSQDPLKQKHKYLQNNHSNSQKPRRPKSEKIREIQNQLTCILILSITLSINSSGYGNSSGAHLSATHARVKACRSEVRCGIRSVVDTEARMSSIFMISCFYRSVIFSAG
jgi:hypothetical protein